MKKNLIQSGLVVLGIFVMTQTWAQKPLFTEPIGVQAYTFRNYFPQGMIETLDTIQALGFTSIEGDGGRISPDDFRKLCDERGISIPSTGAGYQELVDDPQAVADKAKVLGADYVMCAWIPHENQKFTLENAKQAVKDFNMIGKVLSENGLTFCYHAHGYEFQPYEDGTLLDYLIQNTNPEYVSFEMDILWIHFGGGDCVELLEKYPGRWKLMHLKDLKKGTPKDLTGGTDTNNNVPLGEGELDMPAIMKAAKKAGIAHYFIEDESDRIYDQIPKSIAYLRSLTE